MRGLVLCGLFAVLSCGCGSSDDDEEDKPLAGAPLDCAWLASDNCWKTLVRSAETCVPPPAERGVLSADGASCTYASGSSVLFHEPVSPPVDTDAVWDFTQSRDGASCVTYSSNPDQTQVLSVRGMTYSEKTQGLGLQVTCPDGSQFATQNALTLLECDEFFGAAPAYSAPPSDTGVSFSLSTGENSTLPVFDCAR